MLYNPIKNHISVASKQDIFCFNINNSIIEEKYNFDNSNLTKGMIGLFDSILQSCIYIVDERGFLV